LTTQRSPSRQDIELLAFTLNNITGAFQFTRKYACAESERVRPAIETLMLFFEARRRACGSETRYPPAVVESERALYNRFWGFVDAMANHAFELNMDTIKLMPEHKDWHSIAHVVACSFKLAMVSNNPDVKFGRSNDGPVPRFVAAVIPMITEEHDHPSVGAVAKHLKRKTRGMGG
jgi:hypothetical protein